MRWWTPVLSRRLRVAALVLSLLAATAYFLRAVNAHYAIRDWLLPIYCGYFGFTLYFNAACLSAGYALLRLLVPTGLPLRERIFLSMAIGVLAFYLGTFLLGLLHLYGPAYFLLYPLALFLLGAYPPFKLARRVRRALRFARKVPARRRSALGAAILGFGVLALGLLYLGVLPPENTSYDARWYHLPIAEHYAAVHGVEPFVEGWFQGTLPHLSSFLYTWGMCWPWVHVVDKVMLCSHVELSLFLWTLYGVTVLARRMVPRRPMHLAWVAVFLFPCIFVYDSNLGTTADHIAAFWAPAILLALMRAWPRLALRESLLLGALLAAAIDTKYQCVSLVVFPSLAYACRAVWLMVRGRGAPRWMPLATGAAVVATIAVLWAPHWLKNLVWYGDPIYPLLYAKLHDHPWTADGPTRLAMMTAENIWRPTGTLGERLLETLKAVWSFSLDPHDWNRLERVPFFGSLFTMLLLALPFLRARPRVWGLFACANGGVFVWYWLSHQDRYLQALLPWFGAATASAIALAWDSGLLARGALSVLVAAQIAWGSDAAFLRTHRMIGESQLKVAMDRITSGFDHQFGRRTGTFGDMVDIGKALSPSAKVLVHEYGVHLGLQHASASDDPMWQGGLSYGRFHSPAELDDRLKSWGITHIAMVTGHSEDKDSLAGDVSYWDYVRHSAKQWKVFGGWTVYTLPEQRPPDTPYGDILWLGCQNMYSKGRYAMVDLTTPFTMSVPGLAFPKARVRLGGDEQGPIDEQLERVNAVAIDPACQKLTPTHLSTAFEHVTDRGKVQLWLRKPNAG